MHKRLRVFALFSAVVLVAVACSKPKEQAAELGGKSKGASALESGDQGPSGEKDASGARSVEVGGPAQKGYSALNPAADAAQAKKVGSLIKLQSTSYGSNPNTWLGVTKDTIKLTFAHDLENCGVNILQLISNAGGTLSKETRFYRKQPSDTETINKQHKEAIDLLMRYWNDHAQDVAADIPQAVDLMKKMNTAGHPFYGRQLKADIIDAGSFQCPDKQTAAAITMRDKSKPFSAVVYDVPGLYENGVGMASAMKAKIPADKRPMIFGLLDTTDKYLSSFAPYAWDEFQSITKMSKLGAGWICSDLKAGGPGAAKWGNGKAVNAADPALRSKVRKFGLVYPNNPNANQAAAEFKSIIKSKCGITFDKNTTEYQINNNPANASGEAGQIATRFKLAGVTTVIYFIDFLGAFFHIIQFKQQGFKPEYANIGTGWQTNTVQRLALDQDMVDKASMFYTSFGIQGFGYGPGDPFWVYHTYHKVSPKTKKPCDPKTDAGMEHDVDYCKAPTAAIQWYYSWLPLVGGMLFAGPNLTPNTAAAGLQAYPLTRYGVDGPTSDPVAVLVGAGPGQYYFITDGSSGRWRAGFVSPPPENQLGFPDFPDCQRHYLDWPDKLAPQWEKGGANYNSWCGDAKYANFDYKPSARSEQSCSETPSGKCEKDNYPRWQPIVYR
jgi:hypothetical protein